MSTEDADAINLKWMSAYKSAMDKMPKKEVLDILGTHAQRRAIVHLKMKDRLDAFVLAIRESYQYVPPDLGMEIANRGRLFMDTLEELGECVQEVGRDTDMIGGAYIEFLDTVIEAMK